MAALGGGVGPKELAESKIELCGQEEGIQNEENVEDIIYGCPPAPPLALEFSQFRRSRHYSRIADGGRSERWRVRHERQQRIAAAL